MRRTAGDEALRGLVEQEAALTPVPPWAEQIVRRSINFPPFCPHWAFPSPYVEVLDAIGRQTPPAFVHGCYTASRQRKERMQDYLFCLDAWLAGAGFAQAAGEVGVRGARQVDWQKVCAALWDVLGARTEVKELLVRRIVHRQRWWIKSLVWEDDRGDVWCRDQYLGDMGYGGSGPGDYGNPGFRDPYFAELKVPSVKQLETRLAAVCPDWPWFRNCIRDSWLCAPKAFRFLERLLWCVGQEKRAVSLPSHPLADGDRVPAFLQCEDTYPDAANGREWVRAFSGGMQTWIAGQPPVGEVAGDVHRRLGERTAVNLWLVGLYRRKIELLNPYGATQTA